MRKYTLNDLAPADVAGKRVLVRVDYNVPLDDNLEVTDDTRIRTTLPTLNWLIDAGARIVLLAHFGRPKGKPVPEMSLRPAAVRLSELLNRPVQFLEVTTGPEALAASEALGRGEVLLLENTRYDAREEKNDPGLADELAELGDLFVNDAFGAAHRAHSSTVGVIQRIRAKGGLAVAGLLMKTELDYLGHALDDPARPFVAILGGAKISGKIDVIEALLPKTDWLLIGGAMANTFFKALGYETGDSLVEDDRIEMAKALLDKANGRIVLPLDLVVAAEMESGVETRVVDASVVPAGLKALDVGPKTVAEYARILGTARTVLWNGPMGVAEIPEFRAGTEGVAHALVSATEAGAITVVGGGDSVAALVDLGLQDEVSHVSTGGGASLEFLEGKPLPGVEALSDAPTGAA
ncbi:MAG: phosphoglycerate kinase [Gemmatimonadota bacterium]|jgi:phosphoglycerate kinase|nr:phosphoglycerate kinase [Gemmatimonadota bacterium]